MADVDSGDVLRVGAGLIYAGLYDVVNVWHLETTLSAGRSWAEATALIQDWLDAIYDDLKLTLSDEIGTGPISVANVTQNTVLGTIEWSPTWGGGATGDPTASGVCLFAWARTYKPRVQLRKFFGVFSETQVTGGVFVTAAREDAGMAMERAIANTEVDTGMFMRAVAYNYTTQTLTHGVSVATSAEPAYQRRRRRGAGS